MQLKATLLALFCFCLLPDTALCQDTYKLVTSSNELVSDCKYLIVSMDNGVAMSTVQNTNNRGRVSVEIANSQITLDESSTACVFTLKSSSGWAFYDEVNKGYLYAASSSYNYLRTQSTLDNYVRTTITISDDDAEIVFSKGGYSRNVLRYNSSSHLFSCYQSATASGQDPVQLYKLVETESVTTPQFSVTDGTSFLESLTVTISCSTDGAKIYYTTDGTAPTSSSSEFPADGLILTETTTLKVIAVADGMDDSEVASATYTKIVPSASIAALKDEYEATADGVSCYVTLADAVVTYAGDEYAFMQDATGGIRVTGASGLSAGTQLNGTLSATLLLDDGLYVLDVTDGGIDALESETDVDIPSTTLTADALTADFPKYESMRVTVDGVTATSAISDQYGTVEQDGTALTLWAANDDITLKVCAVADITGYPSPNASGDGGYLSIMSQDDITVTTEGKDSATLSLDATTLDLEDGDEYTLTVTTNSTSPVTFSSDNADVATVDETTGTVTALSEGTAVITATVAEDDNYTSASATCTVSVTQHMVALVASKDGAYYAMSTQALSSNTALEPVKVCLYDNQVVDDGSSDILWHIENNCITTSDGKYLAAEEGTGTSLYTQSAIYNWTWDSSESVWLDTSGIRSFILYEAMYFRKYRISYVGKDSYADTYTTEMEVVDGYVRRSLTAGNFGTICLPRSVSGLSGADFYSIAGKVSENGAVSYLVLDNVESPEAGVPYLFCATSDCLVAVYGNSSTDEPGEANGLVGSFDGCSVDEGMYLVTKENKVQLCGTGCTISTNRAYINMDDVPEYTGTLNVNQLRIAFADDTDGIHSVSSDSDAAVDVYTLNGIKVRTQVASSDALKGLPKGIYIVDGQTVTVK